MLRSAILILLLQVDISNRVDNQNLAVLCLDPLSWTGRANRRGCSRRCLSRFYSLGLLLGFVLLGILFLHPSLSSVHWLCHFIVSSNRRSRGTRTNTI